MASGEDTTQEREWQVLHDRITGTLEPFARKDPFGKGDYWLLDENWGGRQHEIEIQNLNLLRPEFVELLQSLLSDFPDWRIMMAVAVPGKESWPGMGLVVYNDEIIDELQREFLPDEFRNVIYRGSRRFMGHTP